MAVEGAVGVASAGFEAFGWPVTAGVAVEDSSDGGGALEGRRNKFRCVVFVFINVLCMCVRQNKSSDQ